MFLRCLASIFIIGLLCGSCMDYDLFDIEDINQTGRGLFITNEGNFTYGNASLSYYNIETNKVENTVFFRANGRKLGDVAQSMVIHNDKGYVVVNNSGVIYVIDINTFKVIGAISGLGSPRYLHFVSDTKAYITELYAPVITVFNPRTLQKTGYIDTKGHKSTEQMVQYDKYVFTNCWSYDNKLLVIDTEKDEVIDSITVGIQPASLVLDKYNKIWAITDGGYEDSPYGWEEPSLHRIDAATRKIEKTFRFDKNNGASEINLNGARDTLYFINQDIWQMDVTAERVPVRPFLKYKGTIYYGLTVDPVTSEVYVADAIDYVQSGIIYRFSPQAVPVDTFRVGIIPGAFCFK